MNFINLINMTSSQTNSFDRVDKLFPNIVKDLINVPMFKQANVSVVNSSTQSCTATPIRNLIDMTADVVKNNNMNGGDTNITDVDVILQSKPHESNSMSHDVADIAKHIDKLDIFKNGDSNESNTNFHTKLFDYDTLFSDIASLVNLHFAIAVAISLLIVGSSFAFNKYKQHRLDMAQYKVVV